ncbi:hypothetical protein [Streptomyces sp. T028]|uniref:hypothetical protein n=1 Tax=Streptomyces sp. T028 TaxID=3394379 RepID=UPI003A84EE5C
MSNDYLKWGALAAALVATASAEYELARAVGFNMWVAAAVPGALDLYTVRALRTGREVLAAVAAMIGVNAASHLVTAGLVAVSVPLVVAVSAIAPLVLWRVHSLGAGHQEAADAEPAENVPRSLPTSEVPAPVTLERIDDDQPPALPEPPQMVIPETVPWHWKTETNDPGQPDDTTRKVTASALAQHPREVVTQVIALTPGELLKRAHKLNRDRLNSGQRPVTIEQLRDEFGISRRDATDLRRLVVTPEGR